MAETVKLECEVRRWPWTYVGKAQHNTTLFGSITSSSVQTPIGGEQAEGKRAKGEGRSGFVKADEKAADEKADEQRCRTSCTQLATHSLRLSIRSQDNEQCLAVQSMPR